MAVHIYNFKPYQTGETYSFDSRSLSISRCNLILNGGRDFDYSIEHQEVVLRKDRSLLKIMILG